MKKTWRPTFSRLHNTPHNTPYLKNQPEYIGYSMITTFPVKLCENPNSAIGREL